MAGIDWKRLYALTVVYGYMYNIIFWPFAFWATTFLTLLTPMQWPAPPLVPWEHLAAATANLGVIGMVQFARDRAGLGKSESTP
jgi:hypothetical protein